MSAKYLKVYGERNTGTNYLTRLIALNTSVIPLRGTVPQPLRWVSERTRMSESVKDAYFKANFRKTLGWKHLLVPGSEELRHYGADRDDLAFLTLTKNPYSWLLSLYKRPYHMDGKRDVSFETFLQRRWPTVGRERAPKSYADPVELWNAKNRAYLRLAQDFSAENVKYEDLVADPAALVTRLCDQLSLPGQEVGFKNIDRSTKGDATRFDEFQRYYLEERWRDKLSEEAIHTVNKKLDHSLLDEFGYELLDTTESKLCQKARKFR